MDILDNYVIQKILKSFYPKYKEKHKQPLRVIKAIESQMNCRTREQGYSIYRCPNDSSIKELYHSCRCRACSICNKEKQNQWLDRQKGILLNCEHFHLVFTLPSEYHALWLFNRKWFINTHFQVVSETLKALLDEPTSSKDTTKKYLKATTGFISVLHTWGRQLNLHPHIHCVITAGGLTKEGEWKNSENDFLVPIRVLKTLYRGKFQAYIKDFIQGEAIVFPDNEDKRSLMVLHRKVYKKEWSVNIQSKYSHANGVMNYLSRYLGGSPIKAQQFIKANHKEIVFHYKDHRENKIKVLSLLPDEFLRRYLIHQPEIGVHYVRYYGLYASQSKKKRSSCVEILGLTKEQKIMEEKKHLKADHKTTHELYCQVCGAEMLLCAVSFRTPEIENSINKVTRRKSAFAESLIIVQQDAQPDLLTQRRSVELTL